VSTIKDEKLYIRHCGIKEKRC